MKLFLTILFAVLFAFTARCTFYDWGSLMTDSNGLVQAPTNFYSSLPNDPRAVTAVSNIDVALGFTGGVPSLGVTAAAINASQIASLNLTNAQNVFNGTFHGTADTANTAHSLAFQDTGLFTAFGWTVEQGESGNVPDLWIRMSLSNNPTSTVFQFSVEGSIIDLGGYNDSGGGTAGYGESFTLPVYAPNTTNLINGTFTGSFFGDGSGLTGVTASHFSGIVPTNNLPIASPTTLGITRADGVNITQDANGVLHVSGTLTNGNSVTNVFFIDSSTIGHTVINGTNQFYLISGSINSNSFSGTLNAGQIFGAMTSVGASSPLAASSGTAPIISIALSTGNGWVVLSNAPTILSPTIVGILGGTPIFNAANTTNLQTANLIGTIADANMATKGAAGTYTKTTYDAYGRETGHTTLILSDLPAGYNNGGSAAIATNIATGATGTNLNLINPTVTGLAGYTNTLNGVTWWFDGMNQGVTNVNGHWAMINSNGDFFGTGTFPSNNLR